jgi:phosphatidylinositol 4-kinase
MLVKRYVCSNASDSHNPQHVYQEDPMKPILDEMIIGIVDSLSGSERDTYDREFKFFGEVTSISGKLKPYIKKSKAEKKVR